MLDVGDRRERGDAVTEGLAALGRVEGLRNDDCARGLSTLADFRATQRRRARVRRLSVVVCSLAAAVALTWLVVPQWRTHGFEVDHGEFLVQQGRVASGSQVVAGEWIEPDGGRACLRVAARQVCGERGARLRVLDDDTIELGRGRVSADGALRVITAIGVLESGADGLDLVFDSEGQWLTIEGADVWLAQDGSATQLSTGARVTHAAGAIETVAVAAPVAATPLLEPKPVAPTAAPATVTPAASANVAPVGSPAKTRTRRVEDAVATASAGELLAAARALAGGGKLAAAATAYQRVIDEHPDSGESRAAWVSLGRVEADRGRHAAALSAFTRYLGGGAGPLTEEAHMGRIEALDALGRGADRDRAIEALAAAHPRSVYLTKARALGGR